MSIVSRRIIIIMLVGLLNYQHLVYIPSDDLDKVSTFQAAVIFRAILQALAIVIEIGENAASLLSE